MAVIVVLFRRVAPTFSRRRGWSAKSLRKSPWAPPAWGYACNMLRVRLLGELSIEVDGTAVEPPASRRARALLGWLALDRRMHSRSGVAARFWPDVLDQSARTSLRSALSALRRALGSEGECYLIATRDEVGLADG